MASTCFALSSPTSAPFLSPPFGQCAYVARSMFIFQKPRHPNPIQAAGIGLKIQHLPAIRANKQSSAEIRPPESKEEAIEQARQALAAVLEKPVKRQGPALVKQRIQKKQPRFTVEIPVLEETGQNIANLAVEVLGNLSIGNSGLTRISVYFENAEIRDMARQTYTGSDATKNLQFLSLDGTELVEKEAAIVVIAGPEISSIFLVQDIVQEIGGRPIVLINPMWSAEDMEDLSKLSVTFCESFDVVYSYTPLAIKGMFSKTEGAILKYVTSGAPKGSPWFIFLKQDGKFSQVSSLDHRPLPSELENALYNTVAANSPVVKSLKFLRGLVGG